MNTHTQKNNEHSFNGLQNKTEQTNICIIEDAERKEREEINI